ncbi:MAG: DUF962 domain-containing protein [Flavobacteriaceae bacterium]
MKDAQQWFDEYAVSHQNTTNKLIHYVCVPAIFFSLIGLISSIPLITASASIPSALFPYAHLGSLVILIGLFFYLRMSFSIFLGMLLLSVATLWGNQYLDSNTSVPLWLTSVIIFVLAWILQFIGHKIEGAKPSFFKDLQFLLIGPAWILGKLYRSLGIPY